MVKEKLPPVCRSFVAAGQCQDGSAKFQAMMWSGVVQQVQACEAGTLTRVCMVIMIGSWFGHQK
jgi:hypothetical protein